MLAYQEVRKQIGKARSHLLLGNGFSIGCDPIFRYQNLYDAACQAGLSESAKKVFQYLGTNNFEGVLRLLDDTAMVGRFYGMSDDCGQLIQADSQVVKHSLVSAVANSHLEHCGLIEAHRKEAGLEFLTPYYNVFTTNYDLVLYWVIVSRDPPSFQDGFRAPEDPDEPYVVFTERLGDRQAAYFLHGALHFYLSEGELRKHTWSRTNTRLTDQIRGGLAERRYPLFVAEGHPEQKLEQIQRHGYLWYALEKFSRIEGPLVVYGHSLGASDRHIVDAIASNPKLQNVYVGVLGEKPSQAAEAAATAMVQARNRLQKRNRKAKDLRVEFFNSATAAVWE
jgi:hypothetical protein